jgi:integrase
LEKGDMMSIIENFVKQFPSKNTQNSYRCHIKQFFNILQTDPQAYFKTKRNYQDDVEKFWNSTEGKAPLTRSQTLCCIKIFLEDHDIELKQKFYKTLKRRMKGSVCRPITLDKVPSPSQLKEILQHGTVKDRAIFLLSSSTGMRIDEILQLKPEFIDWNTDPVSINIPAAITKTGQSRVVFTTPEAVESLRAWFKIRQEYLDFACKKCNHKKVDKQFHKDPNNPYIFPFGYNNTREMWDRLIKKSGFSERDTSTNRRKYHIHSLRKYFRTRLASEIPVDIVESLLGHEGYLTGAYRRYSMDQLGDFYKKGMHALMVFESQPDMSNVIEALEEKDKRITLLEKQLDKLMRTALFNKLLEENGEK